MPGISSPSGTRSRAGTRARTGSSGRGRRYPTSSRPRGSRRAWPVGPTPCLCARRPRRPWSSRDRRVRAGVTGVCASPVAQTDPEVPPRADAAKRASRLLAVGLNLRFLPSLRRVRTLLEAQRIGRVYSARASFGFYLPWWRAGRDYTDTYSVNAALGGGVLLDLVHELDYLGW